MPRDTDTGPDVLFLTVSKGFEKGNIIITNKHSESPEFDQFTQFFCFSHRRQNASAQYDKDYGTEYVMFDYVTCSSCLVC